MTDSVAARLADVVRRVLDQPDLEVHDRLTAADVEGWDSVAQVELVYAVEEEFGISFDADEITEFADIGDLLRRITALVAG